MSEPAEFDPTNLMGWIDTPDRHVVAATIGPPFVSFALPYDAAADYLLYTAVKRAVGDYIPYVAQTIGDCFPAGTMVWGETTKPIESVRVGDRVWTGEGKLTTVVSVRALETAKPMVRIHSVGSLPITCTQDHRFLVYRMARFNGKRVTSELYKRAMLPYSDRPNQGIPKRKVIECYENRRPEWVSASELRDTDCLLTPTTLAPIEPPADFPGDLWKSQAGRRLLGYFLGDGHASGGTVEFAVNNDGIAGELVATLQESGFHPSSQPYRAECNAWRIRVNSRALVRWLRGHFYDESRVKVFPGWAVGDTDFLSGLKEADGHDANGRHAIDSTSPSIANGVVASLVLLGFEPTVNIIARHGGEYANAKPLHRVIWREDKEKKYIWRDDSFVCREVRKVEFIEGPCTVYDVGVKDDHHSFLANGHAVHNCVSHGHSHGNDLLQCVEALLEDPSAKLTREAVETDTEFLYGAAREAGGMLGGQDGCFGSAAVKAMTTVGMLPRSAIGPYDGSRARSWGRTGPPSDLKGKAAAFKLGAASMVTTWEDLLASFANGYPVTVCSNQGFSMTRDADGFCSSRGSWAHCMLLCGIRQGDRPGACIFQSWGPTTPSGPLAMDQPPNSFWADRRTIESMLAGRDSWALSRTPYFVPRPVPTHWSHHQAA